MFSSFFSSSQKIHIIDDELLHQPNSLTGHNRRIRLWPFLSLAIIIFSSLLFRLAQLTIVEGAYYKSVADENRALRVRVAAERGILFDRNKQPLVENWYQYKHQREGTSIAQALFDDIDEEQAIKLVKEGDKGVYYDIRRNYLCGEACSSFLGYTRQIPAEQYQNNKGIYKPGDYVGITGMEKVLERELRGIHGYDVLEVNAFGKTIRNLGLDLSNAGNDITLTLDLALQKFIYDEVLGLRKGAVVVQKVNTGELLALVTSPSYDPNDILGALRDPDKPMFNRAIQATYPPGSVFKIVTAIAGLEEKLIDESTLIEDTGEITIDEYRYGNWYFDDFGRVEGDINVMQAMRRSNDIFFYRVGEYLGPQRLHDWAIDFGYGQSSSISGLTTSAGVIPNPQWKKDVKNEAWFLGNTYHMSIGQGEVLATPLQVNTMMSAVANNGLLCPPILLEREVETQQCTQIPIQPITLDIIKESLVTTCEPGGTGSAFFDEEGYQVGCKTGTAQQGDENALPHAWFTMYGPAETPDLAITVFLEAAGQGSAEASPVAKMVYDWYQRNRVETENQQ